MTRLQSNLLANFAGVGWQALLGLACTPLYIKFMGIEAYGLVGFYLMLQAMLQIFDLGLSPTMNREMARYSVQRETACEAKDLARTLGACAWTIGIAIGTTISLAAPWIATRWIKTVAIPAHDIRQSVTFMGALIALQWPLSCYQGGLMGLQRQVLLNGLKVAMTTLSYGGVLLVLWRVSPTVNAFFGWQMVINAVQVVLVMVCLRRSLPRSDRAPRFNPVLIRNVWRFAAGISGIMVTSLILTQLDKVILSKILSLKMFGYYTLAGVVSGGLYLVISPVFSAIFPKFSALAATGDHHEMKLLYHRGSQLMATLTLPVAWMMVFFSYEIVVLWTGSVDTARNTSSIISFLAIGTALNGLMTMPYALQLAHGWTRLALFIAVLLIVVLIPSIILLTMQFGALGAAAMWAVVNALYVIIGIPLTHRRLLTGEALRWVSVDTALPLASTLLTVLLGRELVTIDPQNPVNGIACLFLVLACALGSAMLVAPHMREWFVHQWACWRALRAQ